MKEMHGLVDHPRRYQWSPVNVRYLLDSIPYQHGSDLFFNMLFSLAFSQSPKALLRTMEGKDGTPCGDGAFLLEQIHVESLEGEEQEKVKDPFFVADQAARERVLAEYRLDTALVMLKPDALAHLACTRGEISDHEGGDCITLISDLKTILSYICAQKDDQYVVFWNSLVECFNYFTETSEGQRQLKEKLMLWKHSLTQWLASVSEESKSRTDEIVGPSGTPEEDIDTAVMDYIAVSAFVERLEAMLCDVMSLSIVDDSESSSS